MEKKMMAKLIAVIGIVAMGMSLGCVGGVTTINDIKTNSDYSGKEVVIEGVLGHGSFVNAIGTTSGGVFVIHEDKDFNEGLVKDIRIKYDGQMPTNGGSSDFRVYGTKTKIKVTGVVEQGKSHANYWSPCIRATSWEYV